MTLVTFAWVRELTTMLFASITSRLFLLSLTSYGSPTKQALTPFNLQSVRLSKGTAFYQAQQLNTEYLLMLDPDRLLYSFRTTSGIPTNATPYGGWEAPTCELRGHFVGHYLSATAMTWASTGNEDILNNMTYVVDELEMCQDKIGTGYLSAFPTSWFDRLENLQPVWAPYYTVHKIMAGLFDQYRITGSEKPLNMTLKMAGYFKQRIDSVIANLTISRWEEIINVEFGGMNEVLYNLYEVTSDPDLLYMAHLFDKAVFMGPLAVGVDELTGLHANTHIPEVVGAARRYEVTGDPTYRGITEFFLGLVNHTRTYATGGSNMAEHWQEPHRLGDKLNGANEETCTQYNILKVARHIFRWQPNIDIAEFYERAIMNGIIGIQRPNTPGVSIYMNPLGAGVSRLTGAHGWGTPFDSFWCCYGTAVESFSKLGDSIYFQGSVPGSVVEHNLWVNQFVSSIVQWEDAGLTINQTANFPAATDTPMIDNTVVVQLNFMVHKETDSSQAVWVRIPLWAKQETVRITKKTGNKTQTFNGDPGFYYELAEDWKTGDYITANFSPTLRAKHIEDDREEYSNLSAIMYGPLLLCGITIGENDLVGNKESLENWIMPVPLDTNPLQSIALYTTSSTKQYIRHSGFLGWVSSVNPEAGTDAPDATFKVFEIGESNSSVLVRISSVNYPNFFLTHNSDGRIALISTDGSEAFNKSSTFHQIPGLLNTGSNKVYSFELNDMPGYYISTMRSVDHDKELKAGYTPLYASKMQPGQAFAAASTFTFEKGIFEYKPFSFVAHGVNRDYLLQPINTMVDEQYTAYFNITMP